MKKEIRNTINEIRTIAKKMPKTINEALDFSDFEQPNENIELTDIETQEKLNEEPMGEMESEQPMEEPVAEKPQAEEGMDVMAFVDDIRKKSLKGMAALADNPDDEKYQLLKKIWSICDKKPDQQSVFNQPQQNQPNVSR